jgi:hypothetical protein
VSKGGERLVCWTPWSGAGMEMLRFRRGNPGDAPYVASGIVLGLSNAGPFRLNYKIKIESNFQVRKVTLEVNGVDGSYSRMLRTDGIGHWRDDTGAMLAELNGCLDVDIQATPFTNLLPIRRLKQKAGQQSEIGVVYIEVPSLIISQARQRYSCLEPLRPDVPGIAGKYLYEGPIGDFKAELPVESDGLVLDYPGLFRRVYPG